MATACVQPYKRRPATMQAVLHTLKPLERQFSPLTLEEVRKSTDS